MTGSEDEAPPVVGRDLIVKADEVDQVGTTIQSPSKQLPLSALEKKDVEAPAVGKNTEPGRPKRPILKRETSGPPPPPPSERPDAERQLRQDQPSSAETPPDSLSLPQLKQLVSQFPKAEQRAYAFRYADSQLFAAEIEDWFQYSELDRAIILKARDTFEQTWTANLKLQSSSDEAVPDFCNADRSLRLKLVESALLQLKHAAQSRRVESLEVLFYVLTGVWTTTAGLHDSEQFNGASRAEPDSSDCNSLQIEWMHRGVDILCSCSGLQPLLDATKAVHDLEAEQLTGETENEDEEEEKEGMKGKGSGKAMEEDEAERRGRVEDGETNLGRPIGEGPVSSRQAEVGTSAENRQAVKQDEQQAVDKNEAVAAEEEKERTEVEANDKITYERVLLLSCWYIIVESSRSRLKTQAGSSVRKSLLSVQPNFLVYLVDVIARLRWEEIPEISMMTRLLSLLWKSILLLFGDSEEEVGRAKALLEAEAEAEAGSAESDTSKPKLTASPLDYHLFRQEITSKYPAYDPPLPLVPLEYEHKSILPPLPHHPNRANAGSSGTAGPGALDASISGSILHQPVHIATPAPSPPPSPAGTGGKAGKKQNYQTNQNFPFLYQPLDDSSNSIGGKGSTEFQDLMVGKRWEGSDIPVSIIEAGQLFASRMRMTRAMKQLWKERELFLKDDRGWVSDSPNPDTKSEEQTKLPPVASLHSEKRPILSGDGDRLALVEEVFHCALPNLQSLVIVMMKAMLVNVQQIAMHNDNVVDGGSPTDLQRSKSNLNVPQGNNSPNIPAPPDVYDLSVEELNEIRLREMCHKAIAGSLFLLLKWFKLSHVLKSEYFTQLLLDSNYIPLALKYFAHQNLEDLVATKYDREDLSFFHLCRVHSAHPPPSPAVQTADSSPPSSPDGAAPPPVLRRRRSPPADPSNDSLVLVDSPEDIDGRASHNPKRSSPNSGFPGKNSTQPAAPSVDELGNPLAPIPASPITNFSFRQFQIAIQLLRVLQKITRGKSHRILLMVQYKSSQILRRILRVPDTTLRLYVLKLFKSQVPYCGRKWRQGNMKVITAIYLHCRPELRDEWLAGMHDQNVEGEVDEALPLEWALRSLTFWWMKRLYGDVIKPAPGKDGSDDSHDNGTASGYKGTSCNLDDSERDFFQRELDRMGWGMAGSLASGFGKAGEAGEAHDVNQNSEGVIGRGSEYHQDDSKDAVTFGEEAPGASGIVNGGGDVVNGEARFQNVSHFNGNAEGCGSGNVNGLS